MINYPLQAGCLLVAQPQLVDPQFMRGVVYLLEHHEGGSMGLLINRPLSMALGTVWEQCPPPLREAQFCASGGPVELHKGLLVHGRKGVKDAYEVATGLYIGGDPDSLRRSLAGPSPALNQGLRLYLGHAGWGRGQLAAEIQSSSWIVRPGHPQLALDNQPDPDLWETLLHTAAHPSPSLN